MRLIKRILAVLALAVWSGPMVAQEVLAPKPGIEATIDAQIDAFLRDDFAEAFRYASPNIQGMFGTPDRFGLMVKNGYPMVWRPSAVEYLELREIAGALWQRIEVVDASGGVHYLDYQMIQTSEGWRINGVQLLRAPDVTA